MKFLIIFCAIIALVAGEDDKYDKVIEVDEKTMEKVDRFLECSKNTPREFDFSTVFENYHTKTEASMVDAARVICEASSSLDECREAFEDMLRVVGEIILVRTKKDLHAHEFSRAVRTFGKCFEIKTKPFDVDNELKKSFESKDFGPFVNDWNNVVCPVKSGIFECMDDKLKEPNCEENDRENQKIFMNVLKTMVTYSCEDNANNLRQIFKIDPKSCVLDHKTEYETCLDKVAEKYKNDEVVEKLLADKLFNPEVCTDFSQSVTCVTKFLEKCGEDNGNVLAELHRRVKAETPCE